MLYSYTHAQCRARTYVLLLAVTPWILYLAAATPARALHVCRTIASHPAADTTLMWHVLQAPSKGRISLRVRHDIAACRLLCATHMPHAYVATRPTHTAEAARHHHAPASVAPACWALVQTLRLRTRQRVHGQCVSDLTDCGVLAGGAPRLYKSRAADDTRGDCPPAEPPAPANLLEKRGPRHCSHTFDSI